MASSAERLPRPTDTESPPLEALTSIGAAIHAADHIDDVLALIAEHARRALEAQVVSIGRLDAATSLVLTVTAATKRPVQLRFDGLPDADRLAAALDDAIPADHYHDDIHGLPAWRRDMTYRLAEEIRAELAAPAGTPGVPVSGDFWPPRSDSAPVSTALPKGA